MKNLLFFGLIRPYKGLQYLVDAYQTIPNSHLTVVGETWECDIPHSEKPMTVINRYVPDNEIHKWFSNADVLIIPYLRASQSAVALIGISYGIPIVSTRVGGLNEILGNYKGTVFVDISELREGIITAMSMSKGYPVPDELQWSREKWERVFA